MQRDNSSVYLTEQAIVHGDAYSRQVFQRRPDYAALGNQWKEKIRLINWIEYSNILDKFGLKLITPFFSGSMFNKATSL